MNMEYIDMDAEFPVMDTETEIAQFINDTLLSEFLNYSPMEDMDIINSNGTYSVEDVEALYNMSVYEIIMWCVLYGVIGILSLVGNTMTICVIMRDKSMHSVTNIFIVNLALADTISALIVIPFKFQAALLQRWNLPHFLCKLVPFIETVSLTVSVLTLCATAIDRYRAVSIKPMTKKRNAIMLVILIWMVSTVLSSPIGIYHAVLYDGTYHCFPTVIGDTWWKAYNIYLALVQYLVPLLIVVGTFIGIYIRVKYHSSFFEDEHQTVKTGFKRTMRKVIIMLGIVVSAFAFCWMPLETYLVLSELCPSVNRFFYINVVFFVFHWLAMCNSCLNPIIFAIFNERFRHEYKILVYQILRRDWNLRKKTVSPDIILALHSLNYQLYTIIRSKKTLPMFRERANSLQICRSYIINELGLELTPSDEDGKSDSENGEIVVEYAKAEEFNTNFLDPKDLFKETRQLSRKIRHTTLKVDSNAGSIVRARRK